MGNPNAVRVAIANYISQHYGGFSPFGSTVPGVSLLAQPPATEGDPAPAAQDVAQVASAAVASSVKPAAADATPHAQSQASHHPHPPHHGGHGPVAIYDWAARIHAKKYELGHGYVVLIFLGEVPDDPSQWRSCPSFIGAHCAFVNTDAEQCANCREQAELVAEGFVHLNTIIAKRSGLSSYEPSVVAPYLRDNLHWRVQAVRSFLPSFLTLKAPDTFTFSGRSNRGRYRETRISGGHHSVEHLDSGTWRSLPDCGRPGLSPRYHSWPPGRSSPRTGVKYLKYNIVERNNQRWLGSILIGCKISSREFRNNCPSVGSLE